MAVKRSGAIWEFRSKGQCGFSFEGFVIHELAEIELPWCDRESYKGNVCRENGRL